MDQWSELAFKSLQGLAWIEGHTSSQTQIERFLLIMVQICTCLSFPTCFTVWVHNTTHIHQQKCCLLIFPFRNTDQIIFAIYNMFPLCCIPRYLLKSLYQLYLIDFRPYFTTLLSHWPEIIPETFASSFMWNSFNWASWQNNWGQVIQYYVSSFCFIV